MRKSVFDLDKGQLIFLSSLQFQLLKNNTFPPCKGLKIVQSKCFGANFKVTVKNFGGLAQS